MQAPFGARRWRLAVPRPRCLPLLRVGLIPLVLLLFWLPLLTRPFVVRKASPVRATMTRLGSTTLQQAHGAARDRSRAQVRADALDLLKLRAGLEPPRGTTLRATLRSAALDRPLDYWIYLPPNYDSSDRRYPVLYMLHGLHGHSGTWRAFGLFDEADWLIRSREIAPLIIVTPQGDNGYWMNHVGGGPRWNDYLVHDLIPHVDTMYRTLGDAPHRAVGGLSMGGHGAIRLALTNPGLFGAVGGHSPVFRAAHEAFPFFGTGADYAARDPVALVAVHDAAVPFALRLDMGLHDEWLPRTLAFHQLLEARGIAHEWHLGPGGHETSYWLGQIADYLRWYDRELRDDVLPGN